MSVIEVLKQHYSTESILQFTNGVINEAVSEQLQSLGMAWAVQSTENGKVVTEYGEDL